MWPKTGLFEKCTIDQSHVIECCCKLTTMLISDLGFQERISIDCHVGEDWKLSWPCYEQVKPYLNVGYTTTKMNVNFIDFSQCFSKKKSCD